MKVFVYLSLLSIFALYIVLILLLGFKGTVAIGLNFVRITILCAGIILYGQTVWALFNDKAPARRDFLLAAIFFFLLSSVCFSVWNEAGRIFGIDSNIFTSPIAGLFSLLLVIAGVFVFVVPETNGPWPKLIAIAIGAVLSVGLVLIAPMFR